MIGLDDVFRHHQLRAVSREIVRAGGERLNQGRAQDREALNTSQGGTAMPVFVAGAHDPDDGTVRWVP